MKLILKNFQKNPAVFMRSCGYAFNRQSGEEMDFMRRVTGYDYPRYHTYIHQEDNDLVINLHIDQKKPSYPNAGPAHGGEYKGQLVEEELQRIHSLSLST